MNGRWSSLLAIEVAEDLCSNQAHWVPSLGLRNELHKHCCLLMLSRWCLSSGCSQLSCSRCLRTISRHCWLCTYDSYLLADSKEQLMQSYPESVLSLLGATQCRCEGLADFDSWAKHRPYWSACKRSFELLMDWLDFEPSSCICKGQPRLLVQLKMVNWFLVQILLCTDSHQVRISQSWTHFGLNLSSASPWWRGAFDNQFQEHQLALTPHHSLGPLPLFYSRLVDRLGHLKTNRRFQR